MILTRDLFAPRLAAYYATLGVATGFGMPFFPLWLEHKGLDAAAIGIVLAAPMVVRIVCVPLATRLADRANALRAAIMIGAVGALIGHALIGFSSGFVAILASIALAAVFFTPGYPLTDAYALRGLADRRLAYGPMQAVGLRPPISPRILAAVFCSAACPAPISSG